MISTVSSCNAYRWKSTPGQLKNMLEKYCITCKTANLLASSTITALAIWERCKFHCSSLYSREWLCEVVRGVTLSLYPYRLAHAVGRASIRKEVGSIPAVVMRLYFSSCLVQIWTQRNSTNILALKYIIPWYKSRYTRTDLTAKISRAMFRLALRFDSHRGQGYFAACPARIKVKDT